MEEDTCPHRSQKLIDGQWFCKVCDTLMPANKEWNPQDGFPMIGAGARVTNAGAQKAVRIDKRESEWQKDIPAYTRLRRNGFQPTRIDGSAQMEAEATTRYEIESGQLMVGQQKKLAEAMDIMQSSGADIFTPVTTPKSEVA